MRAWMNWVIRDNLINIKPDGSSGSRRHGTIPGRTVDRTRAATERVMARERRAQGAGLQADGITYLEYFGLHVNLAPPHGARLTSAAPLHDAQDEAEAHFAQAPQELSMAATRRKCMAAGWPAVPNAGDRFLWDLPLSSMPERALGRITVG
jgi:hypothetical protein